MIKGDDKDYEQPISVLNYVEEHVTCRVSCLLEGLGVLMDGDDKKALAAAQLHVPRLPWEPVCVGKGCSHARHL